MTADYDALASDYREALGAYLASTDEAGRARAYELGHRAVAARLGLIDFLAIHRAAVADLLATSASPEAITTAIDFFSESLATFDMAHRGYWEAQERAAVEREIAESLQRSLLPQDLPEVSGLEVAVRYLPAGPRATVGGDWYDVVEPHGGTAALVVGDVMGHGVTQAAVMGQLRLGFRAYLAEGHALPDVVRHTDRLLQALGDTHTATLALVEVALANRDGGRSDEHGACLRVLLAGHPPPVHIDARGRAAFVEGTHDRLLGLPGTVERSLGPAHPVAPGDLVLLYTDGLLENRERAGEKGSDALAAATDGFAGSPDELCDTVLEALVRDDCGDDVCLLAARIAADGSPASA
jgi:serine phosphatase RsbU (regulator of sigma subunit)